MFGETPPAPPPTPDDGSAAAPLAERAAALLGDAAGGSCAAAARFREGIVQALRSAATSGELRTVSTGVPVWAVLGLQAAQGCDPAAGDLAGQVRSAITPVPRGGPAADLLAHRWVVAELDCLAGRHHAGRADGRPLNAGTAARVAATSAVYGVGAASYMQLRLDRIDGLGCGADVAKVLTSW